MPIDNCSSFSEPKIKLPRMSEEVVLIKKVMEESLKTAQKEEEDRNHRAL